MRAAEELAKRQRESPLSPDGDRVLMLFRSLPPLVDPRFEQVRISANLAVGEMNFRQPNAKTFHFPDGSHLITIFSGLLDFYSSACQILMEAGTFHTEKGYSEGRSQEDLITDLKELFLTWTPQGIRENRPAENKLSMLDPGRMMNATRLLDGALRFILCHELGHALFYQRSESKKVATSLTREQETISDVTGMRTALASSPELGAIRMNLAGCVISLRILAVFEMTGHAFTGDHPDPLSRVNDIFAALRPFCTSHGQYWWVSPIAYAYDEQLESAGQRAIGGPAVLPIRADRAFSRLCAALEEVVKGRQEKTIIVPLMEREFAEATDEQMAEIAMYAAEVFAQDSPARKEPGQKWTERGDLFLSLYRAWPARTIEYFDYAISTKKKAGA
jgi:hypothetical protein